MRANKWPRIFLSRRFRYLAAGGWNTLFGCALFAALYTALAGVMHYLAIAVVSHLIAVCQAWLIYRRLVFYSSEPWLQEYLRFNLSSLLVLGFQVAGLWTAVELLGFRPIISQAILVIMAVIFSYLIHANFSFRSR